MDVAKTGVATRINEIESHAHRHITTVSHALQLAISDAIKATKIMRGHS